MICDRCGRWTYVVYLVGWFRGRICDWCYDKWKPPENEWEDIQKKNEKYIDETKR